MLALPETSNMISAIRPTTIDDLSIVRQFLRKAFSSSRDSYFLDPAVLAWKYWDRRGDWEFAGKGIGKLSITQVRA